LASVAVLSVLILCAGQLAHAQSTAALIGSEFMRQTPGQVLNGSAKLIEHYNPNQMLRVTLGLQPPNMAQEEAFLVALQTKGSPEYHHFLTAKEWTERFDPSEKDEQAVVDWAKSQGLTVTHRFPNRLLVDVEAPVATLEKAFKVTLNSYQLDAKTYFSNDREPEIPSSLAGILHSVEGLNNIQRMRPSNSSTAIPDAPAYVAGPAVSQGDKIVKSGDASKRPAIPSGAQAKKPSSNITGGLYDPTDIYGSNAYDYNALQALGHCCNPLHDETNGAPPDGSIAIATFGDFATSDILGFQARYSYLALNINRVFIDGTPGCCNGETTMDTEWTTASANSFGSYLDTAHIWVYEGANFNNSTYTDMYNQMLTDGHARTMTTSWSCTEFYSCASATMDARHAIFNSMLGQGWSLVAASGDRGSSDDCNFNNPAHTSVAYPASDPDVVGAGGTFLQLFSNSTYDFEVAWQGGTSSGSCSGNNGGSGGGCSAKYAAPGYQGTGLGCGNARAVPDLSLNAIGGQNYYFGGGFGFGGGTSIVAPELAGFFAQENSYLLYLSTVISGGLCNGHGCAPMGNPNNYFYYFGFHPTYPTHYPYYDITSGCNSNDVTAADGLTYYCSGTGWDAVTGWGTANVLQLGWAINAYNAGDFGAPSVSFAGPATSTWYNSQQTVSWSVTDTSGDGLPSVGIAGFTQAWDFAPVDSRNEPTPGSGNGFYSGPQFPGSTTGCLSFIPSGCAGGVGQGWHYAYVRTYDNSGATLNYVYGPIGYDSVAPISSDALSGTFNGSVFTTPVKVTLSATDTTSGVSHTYYQLGSNPVQLYSAPFTITTTGGHTLHFFSTDVAGNTESTKTVLVNIEAPTKTTLTSSLNPSVYHQTVTFKAKVTGTFGVTPTGFVNFKKGTVSMGSVALDGTGTATFSIATLGVGARSITASYGGSGKNLTSSSPTLTQTINKASTTVALTSSLNPSHHGNKVTFTATVTGAFGGSPSNTVNFKAGSTIIGSGAISATTHKATFSTTTLSVGTHNITAAYPGDANYKAGTSPVLKQVVNN
jgi:hypothetical protein